MKIWIDFINTPQVSFFDPFIKYLEKEGHEFLLTCRDSSNTVAMLEQRGWNYTIIGDRVEKSFFRKLFAFPVRILKLRKFLKGQDPDIAVGQSSFYLPLTSKLLGIPSIYTNDNEHALGNIPSFIFANKILLPENLDIKKAQKQGASKHKLLQYPGIKEGIYLWEKGEKINLERSKKNAQRIYIRPEPSSAQYYSGKLNFLDSFIQEIKASYAITILCRDKEQMKHYMQNQFRGIDVPSKPIPFNDIAIDCKIFIGAGGSMTREMAIICIPTISVYQGELLDVDNFLIQEGLMKHLPDLNINDFTLFIENQDNNSTHGDKIDLTEKGKQAFHLFKKLILSFEKNLSNSNTY